MTSTSNTTATSSAVSSSLTAPQQKLKTDVSNYADLIAHGVITTTQQNLKSGVDSYAAAGDLDFNAASNRLLPLPPPSGSVPGTPRTAVASNVVALNGTQAVSAAPSMAARAYRASR